MSSGHLLATMRGITPGLMASVVAVFGVAGSLGRISTMLANTPDDLGSRPHYIVHNALRTRPTTSISRTDTRPE